MTEKPSPRPGRWCDSGQYVIESIEYVRDTPLPSTVLFEGVDVDALLELTRRSIAAGPPLSLAVDADREEM